LLPYILLFDELAKQLQIKLRTDNESYNIEKQIKKSADEERITLLKFVKR